MDVELQPLFCNTLFLFFQVYFQVLTFDTLRRLITYWYDKSIIFHLFFFIRLLSKMFYEIFCRKHYKEGNNCHNLILDPPPNYPFLLKKMKKNKKQQKKWKIKMKKDWQIVKSRLRRVLNAWRNQAGILNKIRSLIVSHCTQDWNTMQIQG